MNWQRTKPHLLLILLAITVCAVYGRTLGHDFLTIWDDNFYVTDNPDAWGISLEHLRNAFSRYYLGNYAPVQIISYMVDYTLWGLRPSGFLFTNIVIHFLSGLLVYRLIFRLHGDRVMALFAAAIFLLHPLQVESVAWISQRKNLLSLFFLLLSCEGYCRYCEAPEGKGATAYAASLSAFLLSLLAKSMTVVFPAQLILYDLCFPAEGRRLRFRDKIPFLLAAGVVTLVAVISEKPEVGGGGRTSWHGGTPWATFLTMLPVFCSYLRMLVWPAGLSAEYVPAIHAYPDGAVIGAALLLAAVMYGGWRLYRADRRLGFWFAFFWIGLMPLSQIVPMISMINDRYLYLPMIGFAALAGHALSRLCAILGKQAVLTLHLFAGVLVLAMAAVSFVRAGVWRDSITLLNDVVDKAPGSYRGWRLLADSYLVSGDVQGAVHTYEQALAYDPSNQNALVGYGILLTGQGELDRGHALLKRLLVINPDHSAGWAGMGDNLLAKGAYGDSEKAYRRALELQPSALPLHLKLGNLAILQRKYSQAIKEYLMVEEKAKGNPEVAYHLARATALAGQHEEALLWLERALQRGCRDYETLNLNKDLAAIWDTPRFAMLMLKYFPEQSAQ